MNFMEFYRQFSPIYRKLFQQKKSTLILRKMASNWNLEKDRLLNLAIDEKRKLYKSSEYVTLGDVEVWSKFAVKTNLVQSENTADIGNIDINQELNKTLADKVSIFSGDITKLEIDAIVNAANSQLIAGGGVDNAIHKGAGPLLQEECNTLSGCPTGEAKITGGYNLPAKYVIQTVGPRYNEKSQEESKEALKSCYENSLAFTKKYNIKTIAFPCISTGVYRFPNDLAAQIALSTTRKFLENNLDFERVIFCTFLDVDKDLYKKLMLKYFPLE